jgi:putative tryptophan/tyrosine transport system substrate-binding protein
MAFTTRTLARLGLDVEPLHPSVGRIEFSIHRLAKGEEIAAAIDSAQASGATALNIVSSPLFFAHRRLLIDHAAAAHLPTIYEWPETAEEGGFAAYGPRVSQVYSEIMPQQIVKLFRGSKVADIPIEQPTKFELVINLKTANAMGVTVPAALVARADKADCRALGLVCLDRVADEVIK